MSEGRTWNSEDIRLCSFIVFFGSWQSIVMGIGYIGKPPLCADRLEAVTYWLRYGRFIPRSLPDVFDGFTYTENLSQFVDKVLSLLEVVASTRWCQA
jgi:hypothetical protein